MESIESMMHLQRSPSTIDPASYDGFQDLILRMAICETTNSAGLGLLTKAITLQLLFGRPRSSEQILDHRIYNDIYIYT